MAERPTGVPQARIAEPTQVGSETDMKASELLFAADKLFDEYKWTRNKYQEYDSNDKIIAMCAAGAMQMARDSARWKGGDLVVNAYDRAYSAMSRELGHNGIVTWNDTIAKDKRAVRRKLRKVARVLARRGD